jgi:acetyltransferase-like isoleucine patch superfamily enzyme
MSRGKYTYGNPIVYTMAGQTTQQLYVGNFCSIGNNVSIYLDGNHNTNRVTTYPFGHIHKHVFESDGGGHPTSNGDVRIGNDVWIGNNTTIMSGIIIGDGAVIANNSHVVKNVEPYSIVGGNPARVIKYRFDAHQIAELLNIKWWDWDETKINLNMKLLESEDINAFITQCQTLD